jgi:NADPH:quinone reductase-like Zn-dependent oxidoreductase
VHAESHAPSATADPKRGTTMRAVVQDEYGPPDALRLEEVERPVPAADEVLVRVRAASVHPDVWHVVRGQPYVLRLVGAGLRRPKNRVPGTDVAGVVETVGESATRFRVGEGVFGEVVRGHQWHNGGAFAEYVAVPEDALGHKPAALTFEEAAVVPTSGLIALQGVRDQGGVRPGQRVLVNGAGGGVGTFAVQLARAYGADVTAVDSTDKLELLRSIGADRVVDYTREDVTRGTERYDLVLDIPGNRSLSDWRRVLVSEGTYVLVGHDGYGTTGGRWIGSLGRFFRLLVSSPLVSQRVNPRGSPGTDDPLRALSAFVEAGKLVPVVDRTYPLSDVPEAIRYLETGNVRGKVVVTV